MSDIVFLTSITGDGSFVMRRRARFQSPAKTLMATVNTGDKRKSTDDNDFMTKRTKFGARLTVCRTPRHQFIARPKSKETLHRHAVVRAKRPKTKSTIDICITVPTDNVFSIDGDGSLSMQDEPRRAIVQLFSGLSIESPDDLPTLKPSDSGVVFFIPSSGLKQCMRDTSLAACFSKGGLGLDYDDSAPAPKDPTQEVDPVFAMLPVTRGFDIASDVSLAKCLFRSKRGDMRYTQVRHYMVVNGIPTPFGACNKELLRGMTGRLKMIREMAFDDDDDRKQSKRIESALDHFYNRDTGCALTTDDISDKLAAVFISDKDEFKTQPLQLEFYQ